MKNILDSGLFLYDEKERAATILNALAGLNIMEARSLLEKCSNGLGLVTVDYKTKSEI